MKSQLSETFKKNSLIETIQIQIINLLFFKCHHDILWSDIWVIYTFKSFSWMQKSLHQLVTDLILTILGIDTNKSQSREKRIEHRALIVIMPWNKYTMIPHTNF